MVFFNCCEIRVLADNKITNAAEKKIRLSRKLNIYVNHGADDDY